MQLFAKEPVLTIGGLAAALVALLAAFGVGIETKLVETLLLAAVPIGAAIWARFHVTPNAKAKGNVTVKVTDRSGKR